MPDPQRLQYLRLGLVGTFLLSAAAYFQFENYVSAEGLLDISRQIQLALVLWALSLALLLALSLLAWTKYAATILVSIDWLTGQLTRLGGLSLPLFLASLPLFPWLVISYYGQFLEGTFPRLLVFWALVAWGAALLSAWRKKPWVGSLPISLLTFAVIHRIALAITDVSTYPFALGWSEISRYYQASFFFAQRIYEVDLAWPVTHPSRYLLQAVPFLIQGTTLWLHRLWQALLWFGLTGAAAFVLARRLALPTRKLKWLFVGWAFLYLFQGAVFYHLLVPVIVVVWGFDRARPWRSLLVVGVASIWAGISRVNWIPMPGLIAATLYFLEAPTNAPRHSWLTWRYLIQPVGHFLAGSLTALGAYLLYIQSSGVGDPGQFGSPFFSDLLWDRLLPNAAFPPGILPGILIVSAPLWVLIYRRVWRRPSAWHPIRLLGPGLILAVLFAGGLVVSVKIGGGTNLHNMDAYMVILLLVGSYAYFGRYAREEGGTETSLAPPPGWLTGLILVVPVLFTVLTGRQFILPDQAKAEAALADLREMAMEVDAVGEEVLFISQRHLLTFHLIEGVPLIHEYEKLFLMEMVISRNGSYLSQLHEDIQNQRFGLIVSDPLFPHKKDETEDSLAAENNAWVVQVSRPILCYYEAVTWFSEKYPDLQIEVLKPLDEPKCPLD